MNKWAIAAWFVVAAVVVVVVVAVVAGVVGAVAAGAVWPWPLLTAGHEEFLLHETQPPIAHRWDCDRAQKTSQGNRDTGCRLFQRPELHCVETWCWHDARYQLQHSDGDASEHESVSTNKLHKGSIFNEYRSSGGLTRISRLVL